MRQDHDELSIYFRSLAHCHPPSLEEMKALAWRWINDGDPAARDEMIRRNLRLVVATVRRHVFGDLPYADFVAEGNVALIRAVEKFDPAQGTSFATYATYWIRQAIWRRLGRAAAPLHVPLDIAQLVRRWRQVWAGLEHRLGRPPCPSEMAEALDLPPRRLRSLKKAVAAMRKTVSTHADDDGRDEDALLFLEIVDPRRPEDAQGRRDELAALRRSLHRLDPRSAHVLKRRFGLDNAPPQTLAEVGRGIGLTRESIRIIERRALDQLKAALV